jgi:hypothetical protein
MRRIRLLGAAGVCAGRKGSGVFLPVTRHARRRMWAGEEVDAKWERPRQIRAMARGIKKADPPLSALGPILVSTLVSSPSDFSGFYRLHRFLRLLPSITYLFFTSMAWKRSSVRSRPGPPSFQSLAVIALLGLVAFGSRFQKHFQPARIFSGFVFSSC